MLKYFAALVRLLVIVAFVFFMAALTVAQLHPVDSLDGRRLACSWDALSDELRLREDQIQLIDRADGRTATVDVPKGERWNYLAPSPWRDEDGGVEAVGRFTRYGQSAGGDGAAACGLVRLSLPEAKVIERVGLEIVPTGRPAWNPSGDGQVLVAAGDGRLYSYRFSAREVAEGLITTSETVAAVGAGLVAVEWRCPAPGVGDPLMSDPVWPTFPEQPNLVIVSLSALQPDLDGSPSFRPAVLWWLKLSGDGEQIVDAGPLIEPSDDPDAGAGVRHRLPRVATRDGRIQLAYLASKPGDSGPAPRVGDLERRPRDGRLWLRFD